MPAAASPAPSCIRHPGLPVATTCGLASASVSSLGASTARDIAGSTSVNNPALPQHCAASGAVDDDRLVPGSEGGDVQPGEAARVVLEPRVLVQRAAAHLLRDLAHRIPVHLERADGGVVDVREEALHNTSSEQADGSQCGGWWRMVEVARR